MSDLPVCKHCGMVGSNKDHAIIANWIHVTIFALGINEDFFICHKCTEKKYVIVLNRDGTLTNK